jgi:diguanylate cyclase (GGDEF)-like protein
MREANEFRILIVDDNPAVHQDFQKILSRREACDKLDSLESDIFGSSEVKSTVLPNYQIDSVYQGVEAIDCVANANQEGSPYALAFVDLRIPPGIDGYETIERMWEIAPELQVVLCTASDALWGELIDRLGWSDRLLVLKKPFEKIEICQMTLALSIKHQQDRRARQNIEDLRSMISQRTLELEKEVLRRQKVESMLRENPTQVNEAAEVDKTTGLFNRNAILERIHFIASDADLHGDVFSILFVDIDHLKSVNDSYGLLGGDLVLKNVAQRLKETLRPNDVIGRYGGEEFVVGLRNCSQENAVLVAERLRKRVADSKVIVDGKTLQITVSVGVATRDVEFKEVTDQVLACADQALGKAKSKGRNRVETQLLVDAVGF